MAIVAGKLHELFRLDIRQALFLGSFLCLPMPQKFARAAIV